MTVAGRKGGNLRFGSFEVDLETHDLRKKGIKVRLQEKPFRVLEILVEAPGRLVGREELHRRLWPDTHVRFDRSLNTAINTLRHALGDLAGSPRFIETSHRQGYRFIAPVEWIDKANHARSRPAKGTASVAVLPFRIEPPDIETEYLSDGITESLIGTLSQLSGVRVMARSTVFRFKNQEVDPLKIGRELSVEAVLIGRLWQRGRSLTVDVELVDANDGWRLWGEQYTRPAADILTLQEEISRQASIKLRRHLAGNESQSPARRFTKDATAYHEYLKGRFHLNRMTEEGLKEGRSHFEEAIRRDPDFALAYAGLSECHNLAGLFGLNSPRELMPRAKEAVVYALRIDDSIAEAHLSLADILSSFDWSWEAAEREYRGALDLDPNYATGRHHYADFLSAMGRPAEAMEQIHLARELDPLSLLIEMEVGWNHYMARDYSRARDHLLKTLEKEPAFSPARYALGLTYGQMGKYEDSIVETRNALETSGGNPASLAALGHAHGLAGQKTEAMAILQRMEDLSSTRYVSGCLMSLVCIGLKEIDRALEFLAKAIADRDVWLVWLKVDPKFDILRPSPAFHSMLRTIGFEP